MCEIILKGIESSEKLAALFEKKLLDLEEASPSDAAVSSRFYKRGEGYEGIIEIAFSEGKFLARGFGKNIVSLYEDLTNKIWSEIRTWRSARFNVGDGFAGEGGWFGAA